MVRIGIDARLTYYRRGGITSYIEELISALPALDSTSRYVILHSRKDRRNLAAAPNQGRVSCWTPAHHPLERWTLAVEVLPLQLDVLHSPDFIPPIGGRYRSVITIHDLTFMHYPEFLTPDSRRYYNGQINAAVSRADHIMTDSEATRQDVLNLLGVPPDKVSTVLLGVCGGRFQPAPAEAVARLRTTYGLPAGYILFVGTFEPRKNLSGLLRACASLWDRFPDAPALVIAGQRGWLVDDLSDLLRSPTVATRVIWAEDVPPSDLPALYSGASVLCLPSFYEGFGLPPLEAMACGTPVVVADRASLPEVVGDAGVLVNPADPESIADGLLRVLLDAALAADLRDRGLRRAATLTWQETARGVLTVYRRVMEA